MPVYARRRNTLKTIPKLRDRRYRPCPLSACAPLLRYPPADGVQGVDWIAADPTTAFIGFVRELTAEARQNITLNSALGGASIGSDGAEAAAALSAALGRLLERAQSDGGVRPGLTVPDLHAVLSGVIAMERNLSAEHQGIELEIVIDGLTASLLSNHVKSRDGKPGRTGKRPQDLGATPADDGQCEEGEGAFPHHDNPSWRQ